jgi:hypothetical protein
MKKLISKIDYLEEVLSMGLLSAKETEYEIRELYLTILDKYSEGSKEFETLFDQLVEVQNLAFGIYQIDAWY